MWWILLFLVWKAYLILFWEIDKKRNKYGFLKCFFARKKHFFLLKIFFDPFLYFF